MLDIVFLQVLNMSYTVGIVILFVLALRLPLKNTLKSLSYAPWSVVLFRLICPCSFKRPAARVMAVTMIAVIIIGASLITNPARGVRFLEAKGVNFLPEDIDAAIYSSLTSGDQVMQFPAAKTAEFAAFIKELRVGKTAVKAARDQGTEHINQIHLVYEGFGNDGTLYNVYFNFNEDFSIVWADNDIKPSPPYRVKRPGEVQAFFERQSGSIARAPEVGSAEKQWGAGITEPNVPKLTITTPRDLFSPAMSSMFGFELVINSPGDPVNYTYACDRGSFCTYKDAKITHKGNNLTAAGKVYWAPFEDDAYFYPDERDLILISVTALDEDGKAIACGTAVVECSPEGGWFKFTG